MKKCIYKKRLKKLLTSFLLFLILFYQIMPNIVLAFTFGKELELSYDEWLKEVDEDEKLEKETKKQYKDSIEKYVKQWISDNIYYGISNAEERENRVNKLLKDRGSKLKIKGKHKPIIEAEQLKGVEFVITKFEDTEFKTKTIEELQNYGLEGANSYTYQEFKAFTGKSEDAIDKELKTHLRKLYAKEIDQAQTNTNTEEYNKLINAIDFTIDERKSELTITAKGEKNNYEIISIEIPGETLDSLIEDSENNEKKNSADIGGILLSPVFYLINFIADAVMSNLGRIMTGDGSLTGTDILVITPPASDAVSTDEYKVNTESFLLGAYQYPDIKYTPEEIFSGKIDLLSIDFISGKSMQISDDTADVKDNSDEGWNTIRKVIASWYKVLRLIAIVGLLSVLIYTGIKIMISANAKDKAKYKEWIINWFIAVAILFSMHYIMAFINAVLTEINALLGNATQGIKVVTSDGKEPFVTNLMGLVRFMIQSENFMIKVGYEVMYIALIVYTIKFTIVYLKRVLNMAFLTLIAPIVALTYPIDKLNDGTAQGFNMWLKEYIFNALLQPMHYIMYYILVGSAVGIAASNPIYGIVVLAFMAEAERILKKIFGFDKAGGGTVGGMTGAFAAGAIASNIKNIAKLAKSGGNAGKGGSGDGSVIDSPKPTKNDTGVDVLLDDSNVDNDNNDNSSSPRESQQYSEEDDDMLDSNQNYFNPYDEDSNDEDYMSLDTESSDEGDGDPESEENENDRNSSTGIRAMANRIANSDRAKRMGKGAKAVGKRLAKPIWDFDKSGKYNRKRLRRNIGRAAVGFSVGTAAAAVQAGISITDGKYNPMEGIGTFAAGYAGGGQIVKGVGSLVDTYRDGAIEGDKEAIMERAQDNFADRDDVIAFNKKNYKEAERAEIVQRQRDNYLPRGVSDLKEMKKCIKYANNWIENNHSEYENLNAEQQKTLREQADRRAVATLEFKKNLQEEQMLSAVNDSKKRESYIRSKVSSVPDDQKAITEARYRAAFKAVAEFNDAQN